MAQHDMNIANQGFPAFRADLNSALTAIANNSSGATEPSTTFAYQWWYDTSTNVLKMRNADNDAWITIGTFNQTTDSFTPAGVTTDKIEEGNSSVEVVDSGTGYVAVTVDGVETARFESGGNLGLGTTNPDARLTLLTSGDTVLNIYGQGRANPFSLEETSTGAKIFEKSNNPIAFGTDNTERMRLDGSGDVLLGTTAKQNFGGLNPRLVIEHSTDGIGVQGIGNGYVAFHTKASGSHNYYAALFQNSTPSSVGNIYCTTTSTSYNTSSDYRLKEDWRPMANSIERLKSLNPVNFAWKIDGSRVDGFLAHELQEVVPDAATGTKDGMRTEEYEVTPAVYEEVTIPAEYDEEGNLIAEERTERQLVTEAVTDTREVPDYQGIDQSKLVPLLTAALQEAITKIELLEARVDALENA